MMKKIINLMLLAALVSSCNGDSNRVFDQTASQRVEAVMKAAEQTLTSSADGWWMEYYPGWSNSSKTGGYWFWVKFGVDGQATAASELVYDQAAGDYTRATSNYDIVAGDGPVLSFNEYNEVMDYFSNPSFSNYQGLQGDTDFIIRSVEANLVTLVGVRTQNVMRLHRASAGDVLRDKFQHALDLEFDSMNELGYTVSVKGASATAAQMVVRNARSFAVTYTDAGGTLRSGVLLPLLPDNSGNKFLLSRPVNIAGVDIEAFNFEVLSGVPTFTSTDPAKTVTIAANYASLNKVFIETLSARYWNLIGRADMMSEPLLAGWNEVATRSTNQSYPMSKVVMGLTDSFSAYTGGNYLDVGKLYFTYLLDWPGWGPYYFPSVQVEFKSIEGTADQIEVIDTTKEYQYIQNSFSYCKTYMQDDIFKNQPYVVSREPGDAAMPMKIKLTSKADPNFWFIVY